MAGLAASTAFEAAIGGILSVARREILILAAKLQSGDQVAAVIVKSRLEWVLACARELAARSPAAMVRLQPQFVMIEQAAAAWAPTATLEPTQCQRALALYPTPYVGQRSLHANDMLILGLDLDDLSLSHLMLRSATVTSITARRARLEHLDATGACFQRSNFDDAMLRLSVLSGAAMQACSVVRANLEGSRWRGARVSETDLRHALLFHAQLRDAQFVDCDLRGADLQGFADTPNTGAVFLRCDLRDTQWHGRDLAGASFVQCKLHGVRGAVTGLDRAQIDDADLSPDGDGTGLLAKAEAVQHWLR